VLRLRGKEFRADRSKATTGHGEGHASRKTDPELEEFVEGCIPVVLNLVDQMNDCGACCAGCLV